MNGVTRVRVVCWVYKLLNARRQNTFYFITAIRWISDLPGRTPIQLGVRMFMRNIKSTNEQPHAAWQLWSSVLTGALMETVVSGNQFIQRFNQCVMVYNLLQTHTHTNNPDAGNDQHKPKKSQSHPDQLLAQNVHSIRTYISHVYQQLRTDLRLWHVWASAHRALEFTRKGAHTTSSSEEQCLAFTSGQKWMYCCHMLACKGCMRTAKPNEMHTWTPTDIPPKYHQRRAVDSLECAVCKRCERAPPSVNAHLLHYGASALYAIVWERAFSTHELHTPRKC